VDRRSTSPWRHWDQLSRSFKAVLPITCMITHKMRALNPGISAGSTKSLL
jgi:hypothetical protein